MELLAGGTLADLLVTGPLPFERVLHLFRQLAAALAAAHAAGVLHRDLKPANVMVRADDSLVVVDFGLAVLQSIEPGGGRDTLTGTGKVVGTADYMAPEQARGQRPRTQHPDRCLGGRSGALRDADGRPALRGADRGRSSGSRVARPAAAGSRAAARPARSLGDAGRCLSPEEPEPPSARWRRAAGTSAAPAGVGGGWPARTLASGRHRGCARPRTALAAGGAGGAGSGGHGRSGTRSRRGAGLAGGRAATVATPRGRPPERRLVGPASRPSAGTSHR